MALLKSKMVELGTLAPDFNLRGVDDKMYSLKSFKDKDVLVVLFICNHCPYVKGTLDQFVALQNKHASALVQFVGINPNDAQQYPEDNFENMQKWAKAKKFSFPYLMDETQAVAKAYDAQCTPDIYVYDKDRKFAYRGRLNDNWQEPKKVKEHSLDIAIQDVLEGKKVSIKQIPSMGCSIKWK